MSRKRAVALSACAVVVAMSGCGQEPTALAIAPTITLSIAGGNQQSGPAGSELPQPLKVIATDAEGKLLKGILVAFKASGGGSMYVGAAVTDTRGVAQDWWTLGQAAGAQSVDVVAVDPATGQKQNFGTFSATALAPAHIQLTTTTSTNFGQVLVGATSQPGMFTLTNIGDLPSGAIAVSIGGAHAGDFSLANNTCAASLVAGASCTFQVLMTPSATGVRSAHVSFLASPGGSSTSNLQGSGIIPAQLEVTPSSFSFANVIPGGSSATQGFVLRNLGGIPASGVSAILSGPDAGDFFITSNSCPGVILTSANSCVIGVQFRPTTQGSKAANLDVTAIGAASVSATLTGTGFLPAALGVSPSSRNYGNVVVGNSSAPTAFTVTNTGGSPSGAIGVSPSGSTAFHIIGNTCQGAVLPAGAQCVISVDFSPTALGFQSAALQLNASPGGPFTVSLSGTGVTSLASLSISPTQRNYGGIVVGQSSTAQSFTVQNVGGTPSGSLTETITGPDAGEFQVTSSSCASLNPGSTCTIQVRFSPTAPGARSATLSITGNPGGVATAQLSGMGVLPANLTASPTTVQFGDVNIFGNPAQALVQFTNTGGVPTGFLQISAMGGTNPGDFVIVDFNRCDGAPLNPGQSCTIGVTFMPGALLDRSAQFSASANPGSQLTITLQGTGTIFQ